MRISPSAKLYEELCINYNFLHTVFICYDFMHTFYLYCYSLWRRLGIRTDYHYEQTLLLGVIYQNSEFCNPALPLYAVSIPWYRDWIRNNRTIRVFKTYWATYFRKNCIKSSDLLEFLNLQKKMKAITCIFAYTSDWRIFGLNEK